VKNLYYYFILVTLCFCSTKKDDIINISDKREKKERSPTYGGKIEVPTAIFDSVKWIVYVQYCNKRNGDETLGEYELVFDTFAYAKKIAPWNGLKKHHNCSDSLQVFVFYYRELLNIVNSPLILYNEGGALYNDNKKRFCCFSVNTYKILFADDIEHNRKLKKKKKSNEKWYIENYDGFIEYLSNYSAKLNPWLRLQAMKRGYLPMDYFYLIQEKIPWLQKVENKF